MQQYLDLLKAIKEKGTYKPAAREGMPGTQSLFGYQFRCNLSEGFPLLTTKKMFWKGIVVELLWFLRGDTNIKFLLDQDVNIWNEDAYQYYLKQLKKYTDGSVIPLTFDEFIDRIKTSTEEDILKTWFQNSNYYLGECGYQYGKMWRNWETYRHYQGHFSPRNDDYKPDEPIDQIKNLIGGLKNNPESRRHIVTAIDPAHQNNLALYWCHAMFQFNCRPLSDKERIKEAEKRNLVKFHNPDDPQYKWKITYPDGKELEIDGSGIFTKMNQWEWNIPHYILDCQLYQRSADVVLGVPFNIASYALLTHIVAELCNMIPGEFIHTFGDVHIYDNHKDAVGEQLKRTPTELPQLVINTEFWNPENVLNDNINAIIKQFCVDDFQLLNYHPQSAIKAELSTGLKK